MGRRQSRRKGKVGGWLASELTRTEPRPRRRSPVVGSSEGDVRSRAVGVREARAARGRSRRDRASRRNAGAGGSPRCDRDREGRTRARVGLGRTCASSSGVHFSFLMAGLTLCRHRWAHCWPVLPGSSAATSAQRLPWISCDGRRKKGASAAGRRGGVARVAADERARGRHVRFPTNNPAPRKKKRWGPGQSLLWRGTHLQPGELGVLVRTPHRRTLAVVNHRGSRARSRF